jgi:hypothetical protein
MKITLPGVDESGNHHTAGPEVRFTFEHRGQAFVRMRVSWDMSKPPIIHPRQEGSDQQPQPRRIAPGRYIVAVEVSAVELPGLPAKTIDSDLLINGVVVLEARGAIPPGETVDRDGALFRLIVS